MLRAFALAVIALASRCSTESSRFGGSLDAGAAATVDLAAPCAAHCRAMRAQCGMVSADCEAACECREAARPMCRAAQAAFLDCASRAILSCPSGDPAVLCGDRRADYDACRASNPALDGGGSCGAIPDAGPRDVPVVPRDVTLPLGRGCEGLCARQAAVGCAAFDRSRCAEECESLRLTAGLRSCSDRAEAWLTCANRSAQGCDPEGRPVAVGCADERDALSTCTTSDAGASQGGDAAAPTEPAIGLSAGGAHTCALLEGRGVRCWGSNAAGQLGDGTTAQRLTPVAVAGLSDIRQVDSGSAHTCARSEAATWCWGRNADGQLGNGTMTDLRAPIRDQMVPVPVVQRISAGGAHTCGFVADGARAWCWGAGSFGQLGNGMRRGNSYPTRVDSIDSLAVYAGAEHTCLVSYTSEVSCFGRNDAGQLGSGNTTDSPWRLDVFGPVDVAEIAMGRRHTCARQRRGPLRCWGDNAAGQIGDGTDVRRLNATEVPNTTGVIQVTAGAEHTCVLREGGVVSCWGAGTHGQLGNGTMENSATAVDVAGLSGVVEIDAGDEHNCARLRNGSVLCWGRNDTGQLGDGTTTDRAAPVRVVGL